MVTELYHIDLIICDLELTSYKTRWNFQYIFEKFLCEKKNAFTPLGVEPRTFRLPVECSIICVKSRAKDEDGLDFGCKGGG